MYVGALIGPGLLLIPALGVSAAGPASILAWVGLLVLSAPLAWTFAALAVRYPDAGGVATYVRAGLGEGAAVVTGGWFLASILLGAPAVALMGGYYVSDLTGSSGTVAVIAAAGILAGVLGTNALGIRLSSSLQLVLSTILVAVLVVAIALALPHVVSARWTPFAPHGWWAVGTAVSILVWLFVGWEAVAQLAGEFRRPAVDLPRAIAFAFAIVTVLYLALAVATITVFAGSPSRVPLADLIGIGFGRDGRIATAVLAVALTAGTMNVYVASGVRLARALVDAGALSSWFCGGPDAGTSLRTLGIFGASGFALLAALALRIVDVADLIRATSSLFVGIYVLAVVSAVRILDGRSRIAAIMAAVMVAVVAITGGGYLIACLVAGALALTQWRYRQWRTTNGPASRREAIFDSKTRP